MEKKNEVEKLLIVGFVCCLLLLLFSTPAICQPDETIAVHQEKYKAVKTSQFLESNLPIVVINTYGMPIPDEPKISADMGIIDNGPGNMNTFGDPFNDFSGKIGIEVRGQSTQMFPKKAYAFETRDNAGENLDVSLLGMPAENDWILYAPYTDKSMLRNVVTYDMARKMGAYVTRTIYCEVILNYEYQGVYVLMEKIKKNENRVDIGTLNPYEISGDDLTGGYIIKVDKLDPDFVYGTDGWRSNPEPEYPDAMNIFFQFYYPEPDKIVQQQRTYIKNYITTSENALTSANFADPDEGYQHYMDVPSFIDNMLLNEISKEVDKYRYSTYFYKEKDSDGGKLFAGPAWDFNLGYGNVDYWEPGIDFTGWLYPMVEDVEWGIMFWWKRLMEDPYFRDLAKTRWVSLRQHTLIDATIHSVIDSILVHTEAAKTRNFECWPILGQYVWPNYDWQYNTYADEVDYFENFLFNRLAWMDNNIPGNIIHPWVTISADDNQILVHLNRDYFSQPIMKITDFQLNDAPEGLTIQSVEYLNASECLLTLSEIVTDFHELSVTVSEKTFNSWQDLRSNVLGYIGVDEPLVLLPEIKVFEANYQIRIRCDQPELLPESAEIIGVTGQTSGKFSLEKTSENTIPHTLKPGIYFLIFRTETWSQVVQMAVIR
jgi:hypothetical protein